MKELFSRILGVNLKDLTIEQVAFFLTALQTAIAIPLLYLPRQYAIILISVIVLFTLVVCGRRYKSLTIRFQVIILIFGLLVVGSAYQSGLLPIINEVQAQKEFLKNKIIEEKIQKSLRLASEAYGEVFKNGSFCTDSSSINNSNQLIFQSVDQVTGVRMKMYLSKCKTDYCLEKIEYTRHEKDDDMKVKEILFAYDTFTGDKDKLLVTRTIPLIEYDDLVIAAEIDRAKRIKVRRRVPEFVSKNNEIEFETYIYSGLLEKEGMKKPLPLPKPSLPVIFYPYSG